MTNETKPMSTNQPKKQLPDIAHKHFSMTALLYSFHSPYSWKNYLYYFASKSSKHKMKPPFFFTLLVIIFL